MVCPYLAAYGPPYYGLCTVAYGLRTMVYGPSCYESMAYYGML